MCSPPALLFGDFEPPHPPVLIPIQYECMVVERGVGGCALVYRGFSNCVVARHVSCPSDPSTLCVLVQEDAWAAVYGPKAFRTAKILEMYVPCTPCARMVVATVCGVGCQGTWGLLVGPCCQ